MCQKREKKLRLTGPVTLITLCTLRSSCYFSSYILYLVGGVGGLLMLCKAEAEQEAWTVVLAVERSVRHSEYSVKMLCYLREWGYPLFILASA